MTWQPAALLFTDVEAWAVTYFTAAITARAEAYTDNVTVSNSVPNPRAARMLIVRRDGGSPTSVLDVPRVHLDVWHETDEGAHDLARMVVALALAAPNGNPVTHTEIVGGPTRVPDESGQPRISINAEFYTKGTQLT